MAYEQSYPYATDEQDDPNKPKKIGTQPVPGAPPQPFGAQPISPPVDTANPPIQPPTQGGSVFGQAGAQQKNAGNPQDFIKQWQQTHSASEGIGPLADAMKAAGYDTPRFMYGNTPSNNELTVGGQKFKVIGAEDSPNTAYWYTGGDDSAPGAGGGGGGGFRFSGGAPNIMGHAMMGPQLTDSSGKANSLYDTLMKRAGQSLDVNPNDPIIRNQVDAFGAQQTRASRQGLAAAAERVGPGANMDVENRIASERVGQNTSGFQAELMGRELSSRRQEIQDALSGAQGMLTSEQQMALQEELAQLGLAEQQYEFGAGLGQRESEFGRELGQRGYEFDINDQFRNSPLGS